MFRTTHFMRSAETDALASEFLARETEKESYQPVARAARWVYQMYALSRLGLKQWMAPRSKAPLQRVISMEEINQLMAQEEKYSEFGLQREQNHAFDEFASSHVEKGKTYKLTTRVNEYGELFHLLKMLTQTDQKINQLVKVMSVQSGKNEKSWWSSWSKNASKDAILSSQQTAELLLLLAKRKQFLTTQVEEKYATYSAESRRLLRGSLLNPASCGSPAAFQNAEFAVDFLAAIGIAMPSSDGTPFSSQQEFDITIPSHLPAPSKARYSEPVLFNGRDISALLEPTVDVPKANDILCQLAPKSREYIPHDLRDDAFIKLKRGILGEEQHITVKFNQPPWEVTDVYTEE